MGLSAGSVGDAALVSAKAALIESPFPSAERRNADMRLYAGSPVGEHRGADAVDEHLVAPVDAALQSPAWEPDVVLAGASVTSGAPERWVAAHGHLVGRMRRPLWGVPAASADEATLRIGVFHRVVGRGDAWEIDESRVLFDLPALAAQAGIDLFPPFAGRPGRPAAPASGPAAAPALGPADATAATLQLVEDMLGGCNRLVDGSLESMGMSAYWHDEMRWHGPHGIGSTHGFDEFQRDAQGPSVASFPNRRGGHHRARFADGHLAAFTGWPSLRGTFDGVAFRGIEPTGGPIGQNIMDFYVRRDTHLLENWVLIDLIDFASQCGVDLLEGLLP